MKDTINFSIGFFLCIFAGLIMFILPLKIIEIKINHHCIKWEEQEEICDTEISCTGLFYMRCHEEQICYLGERKCIEKNNNF